MDVISPSEGQSLSHAHEITALRTQIMGMLRINLLVPRFNFSQKKKPD
jgi:hypothetical protein